MITVFTPTFNRKDTLLRLYTSLLKQTFRDFEWIVLDDGSTDDTEDLIRNWALEGEILIKYHRVKNGGKHRAINKGLEIANRELFFIVDSDDYLLENSLHLILKYYYPIKDNDSIIGVTGFRVYPDGKLIGGKKFPNHITDSNLIERRSRYKVTADLAQVFKTKIFKEFLFPNIPDENFVAESIVWNRMCISYSMRYFNEAIYVGEYLEGGLSNNSVRNRRKNSQYSTLLYKELVSNPLAGIKLKLKSATNFWRFGFYRNKNIFKLFREIKNYKYSIICLFAGLCYYIKDSFKDEINIKTLNKRK